MPLHAPHLIEPVTKEACAASLNNVVDALYVLGGKWTLPLVVSIMERPKRFNEIQHELAGISSKMLAKELKDLELNEFIRRTVHEGSPVTIIYEATEYSRTLKEVLGALSAWGEAHREMIKKSMRAS